MVELQILNRVLKDKDTSLLDLNDITREYFNQYQNHLINEIEPFDHIIPTLENMSDYFVRAIKKIVQNLDGELVRMESSETPTRSYVINFEHNEDYLESVRRNSDRQMSEIIDEVLDRVIE